MDEIKPQKNDKKLSIFFTILLALILVLAVVLFAFSNGIFSDDTDSNVIDGNVITYTTSVANISAEEVYNLTNASNSNKLKVIDCRILDLFCHCKFESTKIDGAYWWDDTNSYEDLYQNISDPGNITDIIVYSVDGTQGAIFCENLIGHVYGKIYNLEGGHNAWAAWKRSLEH